MKRAERDEWTAALRSGDYGQGLGYLMNTTRNVGCCLGVKCDLDVKAGRYGVSWALTDGESFYNNRLQVQDGNPDPDENYGRPAFPSSWLLSRWGLSVRTTQQLASLNDSQMPFRMIADWIDENVPVED